jgi:hypothetical protein
MPTHPAQQHVDRPLSDFATAYRNDGFIADQLCPIVYVDKRSDEFFTRSRRDVSTIVNDLIGPKGKANEASYDVGTDNYSVKDRALMDYVSEALKDDADEPLDPRQNTTNNLMQKLMLAREYRVATLLCTSANYAVGNTSAVSTAWTNETSSTPLADINAAMAAIPFSGEDTSFYGFCSRPVWNALRKHPEILALKGIDKGQVNRQEFAGFFELDGMLVSDVWYDTENPGQAANYARAWSSSVFGVIRVPKALSGPDISAFACTFRVKPGIQVRSWDEPAVGVRGSEAIQVSFSDDEKVVQNDMGYLLTSVA